MALHGSGRPAPNRRPCNIAEKQRQTPTSPKMLAWLLFSDLPKQRSRAQVPCAYARLYFLNEINPPHGGLILLKALINPPAGPAPAWFFRKLHGLEHTPLAFEATAQHRPSKINPPNALLKIGRPTHAAISAMMATYEHPMFYNTSCGLISKLSVFRFKHTMVIKRASTVQKLIRAAGETWRRINLQKC